MNMNMNMSYVYDKMDSTMTEYTYPSIGYWANSWTYRVAESSRLPEFPAGYQNRAEKRKNRRKKKDE